MKRITIAQGRWEGPRQKDGFQRSTISYNLSSKLESGPMDKSEYYVVLVVRQLKLTPRERCCFTLEDNAPGYGLSDGHLESVKDESHNVVKTWCVVV